MLEAGYVLRYARRYSEAREVFHATRALLPRKEVSDLALAGISFDEGKYDEAISHCQRALRLNALSAPAYIQIAEIMLIQHDYARARQKLQQAMGLAPKGPTAELARILIRVAAIAERNTRPGTTISI